MIKLIAILIKEIFMLMHLTFNMVSEQNEVPPELNLSLIEHISPIGWENIVLYGEYIINKI